MKGTLNRSLFYKKIDNYKLVEFYDADFTKDRRKKRKNTNEKDVNSLVIISSLEKEKKTTNCIVHNIKRIYVGCKLYSTQLLLMKY